MARPQFLQLKPTTLKVGITPTETSEIILTALVDIYGNTIDNDDFGDALYMTIAPKTENEEIISCTSVTQNSDGSCTLGGTITRKLKAVSDYSAVGDNVESDHAAGTRVIVSNNPQLLEEILDYIDAIAIAGSPDASVSAKGISEEATQAEINADTGAGSTSARLFINPSTLATSKYGLQLPSSDEKDAFSGENGTPSSSNTFLTETSKSNGDTDQSQTTQDSNLDVGEANSTTNQNKLAQSFIPAADTIRGVAINKQADTGTFTGTVTISIQADSSGSPSGSDLVSKTITNVEWLAYSTGEILVHFASEYTSLTPGDLYWIVIECSTSDSSNHPNIGSNSAGGYASGSAKYWNTTDGWTAIATEELYFKTFEGFTAKVLQGIGGVLPITALNLKTKVGSISVTTSNTVITHGLGKIPAIIRGQLASTGGSDSGGVSSGVYDVENDSYAGFANWVDLGGNTVGESNFTDALIKDVSNFSNAITVVAVDENIVILKASNNTRTILYEIIG